MKFVSAGTCLFIFMTLWALAAVLCVTILLMCFWGWRAPANVLGTPAPCSSCGVRHVPDAHCLMPAEDLRWFYLVCCDKWLCDACVTRGGAPQQEAPHDEHCEVCLGRRTGWVRSLLEFADIFEALGVVPRLFFPSTVCHGLDLHNTEPLTVPSSKARGKVGLRAASPQTPKRLK